MGFEQPGGTYCIHFYMLFLCLILPGGFDPPPFRHCIQPTSFAKPCGGRGVGWSNFFSRFPYRGVPFVLDVWGEQ